MLVERSRGSGPRSNPPSRPSSRAEEGPQTEKMVRINSFSVLNQAEDSEDEHHIVDETGISSSSSLDPLVSSSDVRLGTIFFYLETPNECDAIAGLLFFFLCDYHY